MSYNQTEIIKKEYMKIILQGTNIDITGSIREYVERKLGEMDKYIPEGTLAEMRVEVERTTFHHRKGDIFRAEANVKLPGRLVRVEAKEEDLYQAIDILKNELPRELKRYKERQQDLHRRGRRSLKKRLSLSRLAWKKNDIHDKNL